MMAVWCKDCGARVLLWPGDLKGIINTPDGPIVAYRCGAGHDGATMIERRPDGQVPRRAGANA